MAKKSHAVGPIAVDDVLILDPTFVKRSLYPMARGTTAYQPDVKTLRVGSQVVVFNALTKLACFKVARVTSVKVDASGETNVSVSDEAFTYRVDQVLPIGDFDLLPMARVAPYNILVETRWLDQTKKQFNAAAKMWPDFGVTADMYRAKVKVFLWENTYEIRALDAETEGREWIFGWDAANQKGMWFAADDITSYE